MKLISLLLAGVVALCGCSEKQENPTVRTRKETVADVSTHSISRLEELLKGSTSPKKVVESVDVLSQQMHGYEADVDKKIEKLRIERMVNEEANRLQNYFNQHASAANAGNNASDLQRALNTANKLISDLERERFKYESELIRKFSGSHNFKGVRKFVSDLRGYKAELDKRIITAKITEEEKRLRAYYNCYADILANKNSSDTHHILSTIDKLISDLERERFRYEPELIRRLSGYYDFKGVRNFISVLKGCKDEIEEESRRRIAEIKKESRRRIAASLDIVSSHVFLPKGEYSIDFDVTINRTGILEIKPGTEICFAPDKSVICYGVLRAIGTKNEQIVFKPSKYRWGNIVIEGSYANRTVLQYCTIINSSGRERYLRNELVVGDRKIGGALLIVNSSPTIRYCKIENSKAEYGGGVYVWNSNPVLDGNTITNNRARMAGGGIFLIDSSPNITENTIDNNWADSGGGGLSLCNSNPILKKNKITNNKADAAGGGIYLRSSNPTLESNIITGNKVINTSYARGGGLLLMNSHPVMKRNTIRSNRPENIRDLE